jgi:hypothetical protein
MCCGKAPGDFFEYEDCACRGFEGGEVCYCIGIDNGTTPDFGDHVYLTITGHDFQLYEWICISGTTYFDGVHRIEYIDTDSIGLTYSPPMAGETFSLAQVCLATPKEIEVSFSSISQIAECQYYFGYYNIRYANLLSILNDTHILTNAGWGVCAWSKTIDLGEETELFARVNYNCTSGINVGAYGPPTPRYIYIYYLRTKEDPEDCLVITLKSEYCGGSNWPGGPVVTFFITSRPFSTRYFQCFETPSGSPISNYISSGSNNSVGIYGGTATIKAITPDYP